MTPLLARAIFVAVALVTAAPVRAQLGDQVRDDAQRPPNADWAIPRAPVLSPAEALQTFVLPPGFRMELVAAEPLVRDPVMATFDARGRLWVAELAAYNAEILTTLPVYLPKDKPAPSRPVGRIVILEDTDGDGRMDKRTVYWDNMNVPRAIAFTGDQVLIGDPPNLWLTRDRDGDGVMDEKTLFDGGYGTPENIEASANGLLWGRDNWLYNANYRLRWRHFADGWHSEPMPMLGQWGMTQDDYGRLYYNTNSDQLRGDFLPSHYLGDSDRRMPFYGIDMQIATDQSTWPVRPTPGVNRGYRAGQLRDDGTLATFTAASAPLIYRGTNFPADFAGNAFVPEPAAHLVKRNLLVEAGGRVSAVNAYQGTEFLGSTDERFRPVFLANAPDGALYVVDYYRGMLEGYQFATTYLRDQILARGLNEPLWGLGRIYRVTYDSRPRERLPDFSRASATELVALLADGNGWTRDMAQRQIVDRHLVAAEADLRDRARGAREARDRVAALWCLEGLDRITAEDVRTALADPDAHVRMAALQASGVLITAGNEKAVLEPLRARIATEEPFVLAQAALALAPPKSAEAADFLWSLLPRAAESPVLVDALVRALAGHESEMLSRLRNDIVARRMPTFGMQPVLEAVAVRLAYGGAPMADALLGALLDAKLPQPARLALMRGVVRAGGGALPLTALERLAGTAPDGSIRRNAAELADSANRKERARAQRQTATPLNAAQRDRFEAGRTTFALCAGCHQPDGLGRASVAPSLADSRWATADRPDLPIRIVLNGKEGTPGFPAPMVPLQTLTDEQIAGVLTFVRRSFGNAASAVEAADVARVRREIGTRAAPWTDAQLSAVMAAQK